MLISLSEFLVRCQSIVATPGRCRSANYRQLEMDLEWPVLNKIDLPVMNARNIRSASIPTRCSVQLETGARTPRTFSVRDIRRRKVIGKRGLVTGTIDFLGSTGAPATYPYKTAILCMVTSESHGDRADL